MGKRFNGRVHIILAHAKNKHFRKSIVYDLLTKCCSFFGRMVLSVYASVELISFHLNLLTIK